MHIPSQKLASQIIACAIISFAITTIVGWLSAYPITTGIWLLSLLILLGWPLIAIICGTILLIPLSIFFIGELMQGTEEGRDEMRRMMDEFTSWIFTYYQPKSFPRLKAILFGAFLGVSSLYLRYGLEIGP